MAYNNFPIGYGQVYPQLLQQSTGPIWVQGESGAKSYLVAPNNTVPLWDSEQQVIYLKSADASGMPTMKVLDYTIRDVSAPQKLPLGDKEEYVTKSEFEALREEIKAQIEGIKEGA